MLSKKKNNNFSTPPNSQQINVHVANSSNCSSFPVLAICSKIQYKFQQQKQYRELFFFYSSSTVHTHIHTHTCEMRLCTYTTRSRTQCTATAVTRTHEYCDSPQNIFYLVHFLVHNVHNFN